MLQTVLGTGGKSLSQNRVLCQRNRCVKQRQICSEKCGGTATVRDGRSSRRLFLPAASLCGLQGETQDQGVDGVPGAKVGDSLHYREGSVVPGSAQS